MIVFGPIVRGFREFPRGGAYLSSSTKDWLGVLKFGFAPASSRHRTALVAPLRAAPCSAVSPALDILEGRFKMCFGLYMDSVV